MPRKFSFTEMFDLPVTGRTRFTRARAADFVRDSLLYYPRPGAPGGSWAKRGANEKSGIMMQHLRMADKLHELIVSLPSEEIQALLRILIPEDMGSNIDRLNDPDDISPSSTQWHALYKHLVDHCDTEITKLYEISHKELGERNARSNQEALEKALEVVRASGKYKVRSTEIKPPAKSNPNAPVFKAKPVKGGINLVMGRTPNNEELVPPVAPSKLDFKAAQKKWKENSND